MFLWGHSRRFVTEEVKKPTKLRTCEFFCSPLQWAKLMWQWGSREDSDDHSLPHVLSRQAHEHIHLELLKIRLACTRTSD